MCMPVYSFQIRMLTAICLNESENKKLCNDTFQEGTSSDQIIDLLMESILKLYEDGEKGEWKKCNKRRL